MFILRQRVNGIKSKTVDHGVKSYCAATSHRYNPSVRGRGEECDCVASQVQCAICGKTEAVENPPSTTRYICPDCSERTIVEAGANADSTIADPTAGNPPQDGTIADSDVPSVPGDQVLAWFGRSEEHTSELQSLRHLVCRL